MSAVSAQMTLTADPELVRQKFKDRWTQDPDSRKAKWITERRAEQIMPQGDWFVWLILAGRGYGKTRTGAEWSAEMARTFPGCRIALVAATFADGRDTMVEGDSGLLSVLDDKELRGGSQEAAWNRSLGELFLANGSRFKIYSSERPRQLRGPQHHFAWGDEVAQWMDANLGTRRDTTWSNLVIGVRLPRKPQWPASFKPGICVTTTPKRVALIRSKDSANPGLMEQEDVEVTRGRTADNLGNLSETYKKQVVDPLAGTRLGRQELDAEELEDVEGALWKLAWIEEFRIREGDLPTFLRTCVAVDPAVTSHEDSDETGIAVLALGVDGCGYVLDDRSQTQATPATWAEAVWDAAFDFDATVIVVEDNQGGEMTEHTLRTAWAGQELRWRRAGKLPPAIRRVNARGPKVLRAAGVSALYETTSLQPKPRIRHVLHVGDLSKLEDQMTTWDGTGDSPDRVDALVHAARWLMLGGDVQTQKQGKIVSGPRWGGRRAGIR